MKNLITKLGPLLVDVAEHSVATFIATLTSLLAANESGVMNVGVLHSAGMAAVSAAVVALKGAIASNFGDPTSASFLR